MENTILPRTKRSVLRTAFVAAVCMAGLMTQAGLVAAQSDDGPFAGMEGSWHGNGRIAGSDGKNERIRCRASYSTSPSGANLGLTLTCASDSFRFNIRSNLVSQGSSVQGTWTETTRNATGQVDGRAQNGVITSNVSGPGFTARMTVQTRGDRQQVQITPSGTDIADVQISMVR